MIASTESRLRVVSGRSASSQTIADFSPTADTSSYHARDSVHGLIGGERGLAGIGGRRRLVLVGTEARKFAERRWPD